MAQSRRRQLEKLEITEAPKDETNQLKFRFEYDVEPWNELVMLKNLLSLIHISSSTVPAATATPSRRCAHRQKSSNSRTRRSIG